MFEAVEKLKRDYTDKYVVVDASRPELARFGGLTGQVKTVNMSGRALVQFDAWNNIAWYDIGLDFLKVVPKPEPKPEDAKHAKKPAAAKPQTSADNPAVAPKPVGGAATPGEAKAGEKKPSVAEILRAQAAAKAVAGGAAPAAPAPAAAAPAPVAPAPVEEPAAKVEKSEPPKKEAPSAGGEKKLSTAEILAALRKKP